MLDPQELKGVTPIRSVEALHPKMVRLITRLSHHLFDAYETKRTKFRFERFETFRTPHRQSYLLRTHPTTKAGPWESAHQYGLAVDFVPFLDAEEAKALSQPEGWFWPGADHPDWEYLGEAATKFGLERPISWDKPHVQHPIWKSVRKILL